MDLEKMLQAIPPLNGLKADEIKLWIELLDQAKEIGQMHLDAACEKEGHQWDNEAGIRTKIRDAFESTLWVPDMASMGRTGEKETQYHDAVYSQIRTCKRCRTKQTKQYAWSVDRGENVPYWR